MAGRRAVYDALAGLLVYPDEGFRAALEECRGLLDAGPGAEALAAFAEWTRDLGVEQMEELYTLSFDLNPACSLEVGWHLFGEHYDRGMFLVWMRGALRRCGRPEAGELPDHLTHALAVLGRMDDHDADEFARTSVLPALGRMLTGLEGRGKPYEMLLVAIRAVLESRHGPAGSDAAAPRAFAGGPEPYAARRRA